MKRLVIGLAVLFSLAWVATPTLAYSHSHRYGYGHGRPVVVERYGGNSRTAEALGWANLGVGILNLAVTLGHATSSHSERVIVAPASYPAVVVAPSAPPMERIWVDGYYRTTPYGGSVWVEGHHEWCPVGPGAGPCVVGDSRFASGGYPYRGHERGGEYRTQREFFTPCGTFHRGSDTWYRCLESLPPEAR